jgi:vacuolar-type H+-ATPase subunit E/Vma4
MSNLPDASDAALEPVRQALRATAERQAAELREDARRQAGDLVDAARTEASRILAAAAQEGVEAARAEAALRASRVRREAHELVLAQRNSLLQELRHRVKENAVHLQADPRYPGLVKVLTDQCLELLGPQAVVTESPSGGVIARAGSRQLDLSLPVLAELALESMPGVFGPWTR